MAIARLSGQDAKAISVTNSVSAVYGSTPTSGNTMLASVYSNTALSTVSISGWTLQKEVSNAGMSVGVWAKIAGASESTTVTASTASATIMRLHIYEYSGLSASLASDGTNSATSGASSVVTLAGGSITTTNLNDLLFVASLSNIGTTAQGYDSSFNLRQTDAASIRLFDADRIVSATGAYSTTATWTTSARSCSVIVALKDASIAKHVYGGRDGGRTTANNLNTLSYYGYISDNAKLTTGITPNSVTTSTLSITDRSYQVASSNVDFVKLLFPIYNMTVSPIGDGVLPASVTIAGSLERKAAAGLSTQTGQRARAAFSGLPTMSGTHTYSISDPILFPLEKYERFTTRSLLTTASTTNVVPGGEESLAGNQGYDTGDGISGSDVLDSGSVDLTYTGGGLYSPLVLGYFPGGAATRTSSLVAIGDSICAGTGDSPGLSRGWPNRIARGEFGLSCFTSTNNPAIPCVNLGTAGQFASDWNSNHAVQGPMAQLGTTILYQFGTHDIGTSFAAAKTQLLAFVDYFVATLIPAGARRLIVCTLINNSQSTDGWLTTTNQTYTSGANYDARWQYNNYVVDPAQFLVDAVAHGCTSTTVKVFDAARPVTVTSNNVQVSTATDPYYTNPGTRLAPNYFWRVPTAAAPYSTYTVRNAQLGGSTQNPSISTDFVQPRDRLPNTDIGMVAMYMNMDGGPYQVSINFSKDNGAAGTLCHVFKHGNLNVPAVGNTASTATAGGVATLTDTNLSWTVNQLKGRTITLTGGTGSGQVATILSNTATVITVTSNWVTPPDATTTYSIPADTVRLYTTMDAPYVQGDGIHPTSVGHATIAMSFPFTLIL